MLDKGKPIRAFIAVEVGDEVTQALAEAQATLKRSLYFSTFRWVAPENIHITLKFLGDVLPSQLGIVKAALANIAPHHALFRLTATDLGVFPNLNRPSVLWVGLQGEITQLHALRDDVERVIAPLGFPTESRPFSPHLTLARLKEPSQAEVQALRDVVRRDPVGMLGEIGVAEISLMQSELSPRGPRYTRLAQLELGE
ncbi:MAG: RNA 2',3'-cyclic phosphodiesterase [Anaerolineae bacterium]|nr:RNA 2',3'-cyclic phosphodiesterase [Anaerolineae bacterium]